MCERNHQFVIAMRAQPVDSALAHLLLVNVLEFFVTLQLVGSRIEQTIACATGARLRSARNRGSRFAARARRNPTATRTNHNKTLNEQTTTNPQTLIVSVRIDLQVPRTSEPLFETSQRLRVFLLFGKRLRGARARERARARELANHRQTERDDDHTRRTHAPLVALAR